MSEDQIQGMRFGVVAAIICVLCVALIGCSGQEFIVYDYIPGAVVDGVEQNGTWKPIKKYEGNTYGFGGLYVKDASIEMKKTSAASEAVSLGTKAISEAASLATRVVSK